jgi:apolipoprotein N-acyltransferase
LKASPLGRAAEVCNVRVYMALARAIELRRPLVRLTSSGIAAAITRRGDVIVMSPLDTRWSATVPVPFIAVAESTFYERIGHWTEMLSALITLAALAGVELARRAPQTGDRAAQGVRR